MSILQDMIAGIVAKWEDTSPSTSMYFNHAPQDTQYPVITFNVIDSPRTFGMGASAGSPHQYTRARVSFQVFGNENQVADIMTLADSLETCYSFQTLTLSGDVMSICCHMGDQRITFFDKEEKVWVITTDMFFRLGQ